MRILPFALIAALTSFGCAADDTADKSNDTVAPVDETPTEEPQAEPGQNTTDYEGTQLFGAELDEEKEFVALADILATPDAYNNKNVLTAAVVRTSCQKRGCWMEVRDPADREGLGVRVSFKNYGFFVPRGARGVDVKLDGKVVVSTYSAEQVAHYEAEGGAFAPEQMNADGSALVIGIVANGVRWWD